MPSPSHGQENEKRDHESEHSSHDHHGHAEVFRDRFWISLLLTLPTLLFGEMIPSLTGIGLPSFPGSGLLAPVFGIAVFFYGGRVFFTGAFDELKRKLPGMMTLVSLAIVVAFLFSVAVSLGFPGMALWEELATLITVMLLGHWLEMRSLDQAQSSLHSLAKLLPDTAERIENGGTVELPISELNKGDRVLIRPGARIPADGKVEEGRSSVNESMLSGESLPVAKSKGSQVVAGSINGQGSLTVRLEKLGEDTALAGIMRLVLDAQQSRSRSQDLADRAAFYLTFIALGSALLTAIAWLLAGATGAFTVERVVTVLVVACPHALGLAIPLVVAISTTLGAQHGLLFRKQRGLEKARQVDTAVFDKTGTLTQGIFSLVEMSTHPEISDERALQLMASLESRSQHPIAQALVQTAKDRKIELLPVSHFENLPGKGIVGTMEETREEAREDGREEAPSKGRDEGKKESTEHVSRLAHEESREEGQEGAREEAPTEGPDDDREKTGTAAQEDAGKAAREKVQQKNKEGDAGAAPMNDSEGESAQERYFAGGPRLLKALEIEPDAKARSLIEDFDSRFMSWVALIKGKEILALFALADPIRPEASQAIKALHQQGLSVTMLTGDSQAVAESVARELGIDEVVAQVLPEQKVDAIRKFQSSGRRVLMVGDGINDAPALLQADVGVAVGAGTQIAVESGDVVLVRSNPMDVVQMLDLSRQSYRKMLQNLAWAVGYNLLAIPLAAGVLAPVGIILHPAVGALLMSASTVIVALNAQSLRRWGRQEK